MSLSHHLLPTSRPGQRMGHGKVIDHGSTMACGMRFKRLTNGQSTRRRIWSTSNQISREEQECLLPPHPSKKAVACPGGQAF